MKAFQQVARDSSRTEVKAHIDSATAAVTHENALKLIAMAEQEVGSLTTSTAAKMESLGSAASGTSKSLLSNVTPMAGLIGAGVALSPVLVTVGAGLGALALAAMGSKGALLKNSAA